MISQGTTLSMNGFEVDPFLLLFVAMRSDVLGTERTLFTRVAHERRMEVINGDVCSRTVGRFAVVIFA